METNKTNETNGQGQEAVKTKKKHTALIPLIIVLAVVVIGAIAIFDFGHLRTRITANAESEIPTIDPNSDSKVLVMYFTAAENCDVDVIASASVTTVDGVAKGNVRAIADMIVDETGADLFAIQTSKKISWQYG